MMLDYIAYLVLAVIVIMFFTSAIRILREYERGVVFTLGRFTGVKGPGLIILIPFVQQMVRVDLRVVVEPGSAVDRTLRLLRLQARFRLDEPAPGAPD